VETPIDAVLIGGGIMSATLGTLLQELEPGWNIKVLERLDTLSQESSGPWNNAGTGHSALCELNYTPLAEDGTVDISKAVQVNEQFQISRQLWTFLVESGRIPDPSAFINPIPHMSFVWGADNVTYLRKRYEALSGHPLFAGMHYSEDPQVIRGWAPHLIEGRDLSVPIAATFTDAGSDVDFGRLTELLTDSLVERGAGLELGSEVRKVRKNADGLWEVTGRRVGSGEQFAYTARFVFVGAGGFALRPRSRRSAASAASRSRASSCAPPSPRSSRSTRRRSTARQPWARRRCRCPTSTPASSTASRRSCSGRTPAGARAS